MPLRYSFAAGPAPLPPAVLAEAREAVHPGNGSTSVLEMPFTGTDYRTIADAAEADLRALLGLPDSYRVLFMQGGAYAQFTYVPLNLLHGCSRAAYVDTGHWSRRAMTEADPHCEVVVAARGVGRVPPRSEWADVSDAAYCHIVSNETADGVQFHRTPILDVPLVADMSSDILTRPLVVERYGLIYASAQKNLGIAGMTLVIVRDDLLGRARAGTPAPADYGRQVCERGRINTPPVFAVYVARLMLQWLRARGGLTAMAEEGRRKAEALYSVIDAGFYRCTVEKADRSLINVCFHLPSADLQERFLAEAETQGFFHLRGHPAVGGIRASLYNAVSLEAARALAGFMRDFAQRRG